MDSVGQIEKKTQARVISLFQDRLDYEYLGNRIDRDNRNIELELLQSWLKARGVDGSLISRAIHELNKVAGDASKHLYDRNRAVSKRSSSNAGNG